MQILMIDNYDSFTYNLVQILESFSGVSVTVKRNDKLTLNEVSTFEKIVLSPGPGIPSEAGIMMDIVRNFAETKSILGVCLGHQCIGEVFGSPLFNILTPIHGKATALEVIDPEELLFMGLPKRFSVGRYHSWVVQRTATPNEELKITAVDDSGEIMALRHSRLNVRGVQFHPESILTEHGRTMIENWVADETAA
ncbi:MAG: aminodeoxychorismate/anthranilate synthase component II [Proteobacteria bacterium]|nr:aminodeoxychorismate/anthranilate synthase component II [Pseudomonadota bacterium]